MRDHFDKDGNPIPLNTNPQTVPKKVQEQQDRLVETLTKRNLRPEDDPDNWFFETEVVGPAVVTAITGGGWTLHPLQPPKEDVNRIDAKIDDFAGSKFFVKSGMVLRNSAGTGTSRSFASGYYLK